jgi:isopenicillin-N N-acyltransferase-like protein
MLIETLAGTGGDRGLAHGRALAAPIRETVAALTAHLAAAGTDADGLADHLLASPLTSAARTHTPDLWDEVVATAEGAQVPLSDLLLLTFLDEVWGLTRRAGCSVMARVRPGSRTEIGQTMDLPGWSVGRVTVLRLIPPSAPTSVVMSYPGMIGLCGVTAGFGVAVNALAQFGITESGLGAAFVVRHLLSLSTLDEATAFLREVPHAVGQAYTLAEEGRVVTFEAGPSVLRSVSDHESTACLHTNHPLDTRAPHESSTMTRLAALHQAFDADVELEAALSGDVVLDGQRYGDANSTFAAFAYRIGDASVSFADGVDLRAGSGRWSTVDLA